MLVRQGDIEDSYANLKRLLEPFKADGFPLEITEDKFRQDVEKTRRRDGGQWEKFLKLANPYTQVRIISETLIVWNGKIVVGMSDGTISRWESNGAFLGRFSKPVAAEVSVLTIYQESLISATGHYVNYWDNELKNTKYIYNSFSLKRISKIQAFSNDILMVSSNEQTAFRDRGADLFHQINTGKNVTVLSDRQGFLYESGESIIFKFVGSPMVLNLAFQKELLLANAKLQILNRTLIVKTMSPCSAGLIALGAMFQNLCGEIQLKIEFTETEMRVLDIPAMDLVEDLENLCQLFGAAKFIPIPKPIIKSEAVQSRLEETKTHRATGVPVLPLTSPSGLMASTNKPATKDYFNTTTKENDVVIKFKG